MCHAIYKGLQQITQSNFLEGKAHSKVKTKAKPNTVDGRNPAPVDR